MWPGAWWVAATCVVVAVGAHYSDYSNAKMPEYGGGDYDASRDSGPHAPAPDYYREPAAEPPHPHDTHSSDYKYEEETGKLQKHNDHDDAEVWQNPIKNQKSANRNKPGTFDYNSDEIDLKLSNRPPKYRPRSKIRGSQEDEVQKHPVRYGRYDKKESGDLNSETDFQNEDKTDLRDENTDYNEHQLNIRTTTARVIRRKPRDRYVKPPTEDEDAASTQKSDILFDDERTLKLKAKHPLERQSKKRVESDLKPKPKVKQYGDYDDYYDMKRVLGIKQKLTEQDEGKHSKSNKNVLDFSPKTSSKADWWLKHHGGASWTDNAEMVLKRTSMKQMEDFPKEDLEMSFPDLYPKKQLAETSTKYFNLPYSPYLRKFAGSTRNKNFDLPYQHPYLRKQNIKDTSMEDFKNYPDSDYKKQMADSAEQDFELPYSQPNIKKHLEDTANKDFEMSYHETYSKKHPNDSAREDFEQPYLEKQKADFPNKNFEPSTLRSNFKEQMADTKSEDFEPPYQEPSLKEQIADAGNKNFEPPYPEPSFREQMIETGQTDFELAYPRPNFRDMADTRKKMLELPYPRPNFNNQIIKQTVDHKNADLQPQHGAQIQQSRDDESTAMWEKWKTKKGQPGLKSEWSNLLRESSPRPIEQFSVNDGRRNFEDSANINNIADYGHYAYDTEPVISTEKVKSKIAPAKAISLALKGILNITTTIKTTTTTAATTTATSTTTLAPDRVVMEEVMRKSETNEIELSLAEKSKLSILKKAQRKEMLKDAGTSKPPVLMQVTNKLYTVVMIEPPTSAKPWQRVKEVSADSPDQLKQVKRLMRHKLIANAKDVHDLTENWDDMVCDYVDMALVKDLKRSTANVSVTNIFIIFLSIIINI